MQYTRYVVGGREGFVTIDSFKCYLCVSGIKIEITWYLCGCNFYVVLGDLFGVKGITQVGGDYYGSVAKRNVYRRIMASSMSHLNYCGVVTHANGIFRDVDSNNDAKDGYRPYCSSLGNDCTFFRGTLYEIYRTSMSVSQVLRTRAYNYVDKIVRCVKDYLVSECYANIYYQIYLFLSCVGLWYLRIWILSFRGHVFLGFGVLSLFSYGIERHEGVRRCVTRV